MPISPFQVAQVSKLLQEYCDARVPPEIRAELEARFRFEGNSVILFERRPAFNRPGEFVEPVVAKFRYYVQRQVWVLYWRDRNQRWHRYERIPPSPAFDDLLNEVDADPTGIFWG